MKITNNGDTPNSLQVSTMGNLSGDFQRDYPFLIKNISDADFMYMHDGGGVIWPDNSWHKAVVQDESIYDIRSWSGLVKYLKKLARAHNTMIRDYVYYNYW